MSASSTIINNKKSPSTPLRQTYFASPAEANVANRTVLPVVRSFFKFPSWLNQHNSDTPLSLDSLSSPTDLNTLA
eukprot:scaffold2158_cov117-Alexandrium_tamarense.AAC.2